MTNYGALAILAELPEGAPARQVRLMIALETFRADADGWRTVSTGTLCRAASFSRNSLRRASRELAAAKLIEHEPGTWSGARSRWRFTFRLDLPPPKKGGTRGHPKKGATQGAPSDRQERGPAQPRKGGQPSPGKGVPPDEGVPPHAQHADQPERAGKGARRVTPDGVPTALEPSALNQSALPRAGAAGGGEAAHGSAVEGDREKMIDDQAFSGKNDNHPGRGICPDCGGLFSIRGGGLLAEHPGCPNSGGKPVKPVPCARCGRTGLALSGGGVCTSCARDDRPMRRYGHYVTAICPECQQPTQVRGDGLVVTHYDRQTGEPCPGAGRLPHDPAANRDVDDHDPGAGKCQFCHGWYAITHRGVIGGHTAWVDGQPVRPCPGVSLPPAVPVVCSRCGRGEVAIRAASGLCNPCHDQARREQRR